MTNANPQDLGLLAKLVMVLGIVLIVAGVLWHGVTVATFQRFWHDLVERPDGPMRFRFVLQPLMAAIAAIHDGRADARTGRSPYLITVLRNSQERVGRLREGLNATARIILLGLAMDVIYQLLVLKTFYPNEAVVVALLLAFVPYLIIRGVVFRIARSRIRGPRGGAPT
jgi:drug/metabolite transporter (DMT)-like permease